MKKIVKNLKKATKPRSLKVAKAEKATESKTTQLRVKAKLIEVRGSQAIVIAVTLPQVAAQTPSSSAILSVALRPCPVRTTTVV